MYAMYPSVAFSFQSTPSVRRATELVCRMSNTGRISIHALRAEGDSYDGADSANEAISIHALRAEGDLPVIVC